MENIFKNSNSGDITKQKTIVLDQIDSLKENYREIFIEASESIVKAIEKFKPANACVDCNKKCDITETDIFSDFPVGCAYKEWQSEVLSFLCGEYYQKQKNMYQTLLEKKDKYSCNQCGDCCRLTVSEYSYEQLKQKAFRGDEYSQEFVSVFVPFESATEARNANPKYYDTLNALVEDKIYYYYCTKLKDNLCSDYENRPNICKNFPEHPLKLLPNNCSYNEWRQEAARFAMLLNAKADIIEFYKQKLG